MAKFQFFEGGGFKTQGSELTLVGSCLYVQGLIPCNDFPNHCLSLVAILGESRWCPSRWLWSTYNVPDISRKVPIVSITTANRPRWRQGREVRSEYTRLIRALPEFKPRMEFDSKVNVAPVTLCSGKYDKEGALFQQAGPLLSKWLGSH